MKYTRYTIETTVEAEDILSAVLADIGIEGIEIEDSVPWSKEELDEIFVDEVPINNDIPEGVALVSFYLSENDDAGIRLSEIRGSLEDMKAWIEVPCGTLNISTDNLEDEDYLNSWKQYFHAFGIELDDGKRLSIIPSWESHSENEESDYVLNIDPGTAFGTGAHETTKLCIKALSKYVRHGMKILDLGTGSGILSMAAFKLGATVIRATDLDVNAVPAVKDNFEKNGLSDADFKLMIGDAVTDRKVRQDLGNNYDIVVANILPVVLIPLTEVIGEMVKQNGMIIYSGILTEKAPEVKAALEKRGFKIIEQTELGEWCCLVAG